MAASAKPYCAMYGGGSGGGEEGPFKRVHLSYHSRPIEHYLIQNASSIIEEYCSSLLLFTLSRDENVEVRTKEGKALNIMVFFCSQHRPGWTWS
ncbi:hypothetical protein SUGI_1061160 [Cryptomeria japonica]|nr:hypothetical protein SUGI_1061160 [Cryptomeria japonica]